MADLFKLYCIGIPADGVLDSMPSQAGTDGSMALTLPVSSHPGHLHSAWLVSQMYTNYLFRQLLTDSENSYHVGHANSRD